MPPTTLVPRFIVANHRHYWPEAEIAATGAQGVRTLVYNTPEFATALQQLHAHRWMPAIATLNNEHKTVRGDWSGWHATAHEFVQAIDPIDCPWVVLINEPDIWKLDPQFVADLVNSVAPIYAAAGFKLALPSVAGENWVEYARELATRIDLRHIAAATGHFYGRPPTGIDFQSPDFGPLAEAVLTLRNETGLPVMIDETGVKLVDVRHHPSGPESGQAEYVHKFYETLDALGTDIVVAAAYFALGDQVGTPAEQGASAFGLIASSGLARPALGAFAHQAGLLPDPVRPVMEESGVYARNDALREAFGVLWDGYREGIPFDPAFALCRYWLEHHDEMGSPMDAEIEVDDGGRFQPFTNGVWEWTVDGAVRRARWEDA